MSIVRSAPRWTPPMPPVAKTRMPAMWAIIIVVVTVVAPSRPCAARTARSRRDALATCAPALPRCSISSWVRPAFSRPPMIAIVAGVAPLARISSSTARAVSTFCG